MFLLHSDNHDPNNGSVWYLEGSHRLGKLPIEVDEERTVQIQRIGETKEVNLVYYQRTIIFHT